MKRNLGHTLKADLTLVHHYWVIQDWGGIRSFKVKAENDLKIRLFRDQLNDGRLTRDSFGTISFLSKLSSFWNPGEYAIYDSRSVFALNWLIFRYGEGEKLFPQPQGRSATLAKYDLQTIFRLSRKPVEYHSYRTAYFEYCGLLKKMSEATYLAIEPFFAEMLLFLAAPQEIIFDIERSVTVNIPADERPKLRTSSDTNGRANMGLLK